MKHPLAQFLYCPECGSPHFEVNNEKSKKCTACGFVYYFNPSSATVAGQRDTRPSRRIYRHERNGRRRGKQGSMGGNRIEGRKSDLSVLPAEHLYLFRLSRSYARYVLSLYRKRHEPFLGNGWRGRFFLPAIIRDTSGRFRAGFHSAGTCTVSGSTQLTKRDTKLLGIRKRFKWGKY